MSSFGTFLQVGPPPISTAGVIDGEREPGVADRDIAEKADGDGAADEDIGPDTDRGRERDRERE